MLPLVQLLSLETQLQEFARLVEVTVTLAMQQLQLLVPCAQQDGSSILQAIYALKTAPSNSLVTLQLEYVKPADQIVRLVPAILFVLFA